MPSLDVMVKADSRSSCWQDFSHSARGRFEMENKREQFNGDGKECVHHWLINASNLGICKKCGVSKQFCSSWGTIQKSWYARAGNAHHVVPGIKS